MIIRLKMNSKFEIAFRYLIDNEGGFSDDPDDSGGKTIFGIASKYHPKIYKEVYKMYKEKGRERALGLAKRFYYKEFWNPDYDLIKDSSLAFRLFDFGVNASKERAVKIFQKSINFFKQNKIKVDGIFGAITLINCNSIVQERLYLLYTIKIYLYYMTRSTAWKYLRVWTLRLVKRYYLDI